MIKKEKLTQGIVSVMDIHKQLVPLLSKHISVSIFFSGLSKSDKEEMTN